jgi:hypothetical protein
MTIGKAIGEAFGLKDGFSRGYRGAGASLLDSQPDVGAEPEPETITLQPVDEAAPRSAARGEQQRGGHRMGTGLGILDAIRSRFAPDALDSEGLRQELDGWLAKLDQNAANADTVKRGLALAAIRDGGKTSTDKLEQLDRERVAIQATVDALRVEIEAALSAEADTARAADRAQRKRRDDERAVLAHRCQEQYDAFLESVVSLINSSNNPGACADRLCLTLAARARLFDERLRIDSRSLERLDSAQLGPLRSIVDNRA